ncbi:MAG TPA: PLDc N-terminal domain-containing protein [Gaiellaceae bacterium]|nr:PLDc N-terminal domain-containing protein [Gaiellaceae bacterium]
MTAGSLFALSGLGWGLTIGGVIAAILALVTVVAVVQNAELSGSEKAMWIVAAIIFPILGAAVYFTVRREW